MNRFVYLGLLVAVFMVGTAIWYGQNGQLFGATILTTNSSDTLTTFRTNVNTSLTNLNNAVLAAATSTNPLMGAYIVATSTATSTFAGGVQTTALNITSTTASSTFANGLQLSKGCFQMPSGTCLPNNPITDLTGDVTASGPGSVAATLVMSIAHIWTGLQQFNNAATTTIAKGFYSGFIASPVFQATSTTASSTFANGLNITDGCFSYKGTCIAGSGFVVPSTFVGTTTATTTLDTAEVGLASTTVPANTLGTNNMVYVYVPITAISNVGAQVANFKFYYGQSSLCTISLPSKLFALSDGTLEMRLVGNSATNKQVAFVKVQTLAADSFTTGLNEVVSQAMCSGAVDSTVAQTIKITGAWTAGDGGTNLTSLTGFVTVNTR